MCTDAVGDRARNEINGRAHTQIPQRVMNSGRAQTQLSCIEHAIVVVIQDMFALIVTSLSTRQEQRWVL
jgi:hypothetical protein